MVTMVIHVDLQSNILKLITDVLDIKCCNQVEHLIRILLFVKCSNFAVSTEFCAGTELWLIAGLTLLFC